MKHLMNKLFGEDGQLYEYTEKYEMEYMPEKHISDHKYNEMDMSRSKHSLKRNPEHEMHKSHLGSKEKEYCDMRLVEHVKEHNYHLDKELLECALDLLDFEEDEMAWTVEETEHVRNSNRLHFDGELSRVNKYDFNFMMNKRKVKDKYKGRSASDIAYRTWESLHDDTYPYPEAKAFFCFLDYLYSTMAEKGKLFK